MLQFQGNLFKVDPEWNIKLLDTGSYIAKGWDGAEY